MQLLHANTELRLSQAKGLKVGRTDIPNSSPAIADSLDTLKAVATFFGIDFDRTRFTFTVKVDEDGKRTVFSPQVGNVDGVPSIVWGRVSKPLSEVPAAEFIQEGAIFAAFYPETLDEPIEIRCRTIRDAKLTEVKAAANKGKLADKLDRVIVPAISLTELFNTSGERQYSFTAYQLGDFKGQQNSSILVEGIGWVKGNTGLTKALSASPVVTAEQPASFYLKDTGKEMNGNKIFNTAPLHFSSITEDDLSDLGVDI